MTQINDVVRLVGDRPDDGLHAGALGTVVEVFDAPRRAFEVEFIDGDGATIAIVTLAPHEVEPARS